MLDEVMNPLSPDSWESLACAARGLHSMTYVMAEASTEPPHTPPGGRGLRGWGPPHKGSEGQTVNKP